MFFGLVLNSMVDSLGVDVFSMSLREYLFAFISSGFILLNCLLFKVGVQLIGFNMPLFKLFLKLDIKRFIPVYHLTLCLCFLGLFTMLYT